MRPWTRHLFTIGTVALLLLGAFAVSGTRGLVAQDATPVAAEGRPVHIHAGSCDDLGDVVAPMIDLTAPQGTAVGQEVDEPVEYSFSTVPMALDTIVATDHAINAHESAEAMETNIACGDIGGVIDANGSLVIALHEQDDSGFHGIAVLTPNPDDATQTDISTFIHFDEAAEDAEDADETEEADEAAENTVEVSLTEFAIDAPTELPAGTTTFQVTNDDTIEHNLEVEGQGIEEELEANLQPGESGTLTVDLEPGTYELYCPVGNHQGQGMTLEVTVTE